MQAVPLLKMPDPHQLSHIAIGNVVRPVQTVQIMVPHNHEPLSPHQPLLMIEDGTADTGIVPARPFVGAAEHHDLVLPVLAIGVRERFQQFPAGNALHVRKNGQTQ